MSDADDFNARIIEEFRANAGRVGGMFEGVPLVLLTTTGAKSGRQRVAPLVPLRQGGRVYVFASKGGAPTNPDWYHNLVAHPEVTVELGSESYQATARVLSGADRDRVYAAQVAEHPQFGEYQAKAHRTIPIVELDRAT
jgi:deazaflavin-dependent oxidoreductase (nitroreductase family)